MTEDEVTAAQRCWTAETLTALYDPFAYPKTEKKNFVDFDKRQAIEGAIAGRRF